MNTRPFFRRVFLPAMLSLLVGFLVMPALNVVRVDARGMGTEHASPWRSRANGLAAAAVSAVAFAGAFLNRMRRRFERAEAHPLFKPLAALAVIALVVLFDHKALFAAPVIFGATATETQHAGEFLLEERMEAGRPSRDNITVLSGQNLKAGAVLGRVTKGIGRVSIPAVVGTGNGTVSNVYAGPDVQVGNYVVTCTAAVANGGVFSVVCPDGTALPPLTMTPGAGGTTKFRSRHINFTITDGGTDFIVNDVFTFVVSTTAPTVIGGTGTGTISALALGPEARPGNYRIINTAAVVNGGVFQVYRGGPDGGDSIGTFTMTPGAGGATVFETRHFSFTLTDNADFIVGNYFDVCVFNQLAGGKAVAWDPTSSDGRNDFAGILYDNVDASLADVAGVIVARDAAVQLSALQWGAAISASEKISAQADMLKRGIVAR